MDAPPPNPSPRDQLRNYLAFLSRSGFLYLTPTEKSLAQERSRHERAERLEALRQKVVRCTRCPLAGGRKHVVFGEGNPDAALMFVGEGPGQREDELGRPFVGRAGQLLDEMMREVGLRREEVFIGNIVKCRPPGNRDPLSEEIEACEPYLRAQIEQIRPRVVVALGRFAAHCLTGTQTPISRMRGRWHQYEDCRLMPTLHPAAVLRNINQRPMVVEDLRRAVEFLNQ